MGNKTARQRWWRFRVRLSSSFGVSVCVLECFPCADEIDINRFSVGSSIDSVYTQEMMILSHWVVFLFYHHKRASDLFSLDVLIKSEDSRAHSQGSGFARVQPAEASDA